MLSENEISHLLADAKDLWLSAESFNIGYQKLYRSKAKLASYLRMATIVAGILTAISTNAFFDAYPVITTIAALITGCSAVVSQVLVPEKTQRESWQSWKKIESFKSDLSSRARGLKSANSYKDELFVFQKFRKTLYDLASADIDITDKVKNKAEENYKKINLKPIEVAAGEMIAAEIDEADEGMDEAMMGEVPDVEQVAVFTRRVAENEN